MVIVEVQSRRYSCILDVGAVAESGVGPSVTQSAVKNGTIPAAAYVRFCLVDLVVHGWDLLHAAQLDETLDPPVVAAVLRVVEPHLDDMLAIGAYGAGPSGSLPAGVSPQARLLDWFRRRPQPVLPTVTPVLSHPFATLAWVMAT